jgi:hypothetical protein
MPRPKPFLRLFFGVFGWCAALTAVSAIIGVLLALDAGDRAAHLRAEGAETDSTTLLLTKKHRHSLRTS